MPAWIFYRDGPRFLIAQNLGFRSIVLMLLVGLSQIVSPLGYLFQCCVGPRKFARPRHLMDQADGTHIPVNAPVKQASRSRM